MSVIEIATPRWAIPALQPARYKAIYGGRGSGKSHFVGEYIIEEHILHPDDSTVCVREVQKSLSQSVKRLLESKIAKLNAGWYFDVLENEIRTKSGTGVITFQGMQNHTADSIKSLEGYKRAWVEEAQTLSQYSLDLLRPTIRTPGSELIFTWNPRYRTDPVDALFRKRPPTNSIVIPVNWDQNPWFPDELRQEMADDFEADEDKAEHVWNGEYGASQGAILAKWIGRAERAGRIHDGVEFDARGAGIVISADLGFHDTASFWFWQPAIGGFRVLRYESGSGMDADDWIEELKKILSDHYSNKLDKIWLPHDARAKTFQSKHTTAEKFISAFGASRVGIVPIARKADQISASRTMIPKCEFHKTDCEDGLNGLIAYEYKYNEELGVLSRDPKHDWASHPSDAFHYGAQVLDENKPKEPEKAPVFPVTGHNGRIVTGIDLNSMWEETQKRTERY